MTSTNIDPVTRVAQDLATLMMSLRDLLADDAYAAMLPHLDALAAVLPDRLAPSPLARHVTVAPAPYFPGEQ